ncbi:PREDICTED: uncharacterized protein LOC108557265, partial [Nicrophorus vespilloides]|uniref:Uncharacterized protein LOC108557265 n=1 Tax=Nicrophorus vespilloides TaxID=110193 RepID=A0ABM1M3P5_NICVS
MLLISMLIITYFSIGASSVQINYIKVPPSVRNNTNRPVILDCNYSVRPDDTDLVVKWLLNDEVVYQWIPPKLPQSLGVLKDRIDLSYAATNNPNTVHRAIKINNPITSIEGEYKCFVSTFADEDFSAKVMIIFEPEKSLDMYENKPSRSKINFTCMASKVYPKPKLSLYRDKKNDVINKNPLEAIEWDTVRHQEDGRFSSFIVATANLDDLDPGDLINCELRIPMTGYVKRKSLIYYPLEMTTRNCVLSFKMNL